MAIRATPLIDELSLVDGLPLPLDWILHFSGQRRSVRRPHRYRNDKQKRSCHDFSQHGSSSKMELDCGKQKDYTTGFTPCLLERARSAIPIGRNLKKS